MCENTTPGDFLRLAVLLLSSSLKYDYFPPSTHQIPHGDAFPPPVGVEIDPRGIIDTTEIQHEQPVIRHVHVIARDEQTGHPEQVLALRFGVRSAQRGSHEPRGPLR